MEFVCGLDFLQSGEALVEQNVIVVAGKHELLPGYFYLTDVAP